MKPQLCRYAVGALSLCLAISSVSAIEIKGGMRAPAKPAGTYAATTAVATGVLTTLDGKGGRLVLDATRRFDFDPAKLVVRRQSNQGGVLRPADLGAGTRVSLTVVRRSPNSAWVVSEVWIAP